MRYGLQKRWWRETPETAPGHFFSASSRLAAATDGDGPLELAGVRGLTNRNRGRVLSRYAAVRSRMVAGIGAGDRRNGGARRLTAVAHYRAVGVEEKGPYEPWTNPGAREGVGEGA